MTENEKLDLILAEIHGMKQDMQGMKQDMQGMKQDMQGMKQDMQNMKQEIQGMKQDIQNMKQEIQELDKKTTGIALHLENGTDKNIQLIAENFIELTKKLNQAIPAADKNLAYEVKVNYLIEEVAFLKQEVADLKSKIA